MVIAQQSWFGHEVHVDRVVRVRAADIPDLVAFLGVFLPFVAGRSAVHRLERAAVRAVQRVLATVAVQEVDARAAVQVIVARITKCAVQAGIFEFVASRRNMTVRIDEHAECSHLHVQGGHASHRGIGGELHLVAVRDISDGGSRHLALEDCPINGLLDVLHQMGHHGVRLERPIGFRLRPVGATGCDDNFHEVRAARRAEQNDRIVSENAVRRRDLAADLGIACRRRGVRWDCRRNLAGFEPELRVERVRDSWIDRPGVEFVGPKSAE